MENHKTLMKEIVGANNWEIILYYMNLFELDGTQNRTTIDAFKVGLADTNKLRNGEELS